MLPTIFHHSLMEWWCRVPGRSGSTAWEDEKGWGDDNWDEPGAMQAKIYGLAFGTAARACPPRRSSGDSRGFPTPALSGLRGTGDARQACRC